MFSKGGGVLCGVVPVLGAGVGGGGFWVSGAESQDPANYPRGLPEVKCLKNIPDDDGISVVYCITRMPKINAAGSARAAVREHGRFFVANAVPKMLF